MNARVLLHMKRTIVLIAPSKVLFATPLIAVVLLGALTAKAQQSPDPRIADLVASGKVRVGVGLGSPPVAIKDPVTGELRGPAWDVARALAARVGVALLPVEYPRPGAVMEGAQANAWDVALLGIDPSLAAQVDFSPPYIQYDLTYMVAAGSSIRNVADVDQTGVRIAVPRGDISDLRLSRMLKRAELVRANSIPAMFDLLRTGHAELCAGTRPGLLEESARLPDFRVLDDHFGVILVAMVVPKGHAGHLAYISDFIDQAKASGLVQQAIERSGLRGVQVVAPTGNSGTQK